MPIVLSLLPPGETNTTLCRQSGTQHLLSLTVVGIHNYEQHFRRNFEKSVKLLFEQEVLNSCYKCLPGQDTN